MKYILTPKNEGHDLDCQVTVSCSKREALQVARTMAANLTAALLLQCEVAVHIQTVSEGLRGVEGIIARHDGKIIDGQTGKVLPAES